MLPLPGYVDNFVTEMFPKEDYPAMAHIQMTRVLRRRAKNKLKWKKKERID